MKELSLNNCRLDKRYDIREQLGRGSYAEIFLARDILASTQSPHSTVVIKALNVFLQDDLDNDLERTLVENFQNEAIALDRVRHPNIISRIGHGTARDLRGTVFHYIVLEYLSGGDLQNAVRKHDISLKQAMNYVEQVCAGLGHAHRHGIIHRDIKPQNLLLTADLATVKIADFGVARITLSDSPITRVGTNVYAPPEHSPMFTGQTGTLAFAQLTPAADIYSLAKSVYTLVTGEAPRIYANQPITDLPDSVKDEEWAGEIIRVLRKATLDDPRSRQQNVEEFWDDLAVVREFAANGETPTVVRSGVAAFAAPQAHVARGYTPVIPDRPHFEPVSDPAFHAPPRSHRMQPAMSYAELPSENGVAVVRTPIQYDFSNLDATVPVRSSDYAPPAQISTAPTKKRKALRRLLTFAIFLALFTGILYGTASFMRGRGILPEIRNPFRTQTAVANTDINLRPSPNTDNDSIGLVTKNSKVRIVNSQNNWYQVDIIEQGRVGGTTATRGWLNGKYLDIDGN